LFCAGAGKSGKAMTTIELQQERGGLIAQARKIHETYTAEKRGATAEEGAEIDRLLDAADTLEAQIKRKDLASRSPGTRAERLEHASADLRTITDSGMRPMPDGQGHPRARRAAGDDEVRALGREERMAAYLADRAAPLPDGIRTDDLSLGRAIRAMVLGDWRAAPAEARAMGTGTSVTGGLLVPTMLSARVIDLARNQARIFQAGALTVPMETKDVNLAKITKDPVASWKAENQPATASDIELGQITLQSRTLVALVKASVELMEDAQNFSSVVENALAAALALELDRAALRGGGAGIGPIEPVGLRFTTGVNLVAVNGFWDYDDVSTGVQKIVEANGPSADALAVLLSPRDYGFADRLKDGNGLPLEGPPSWQAMTKLATNQIPTNLGVGTNESEIYVGAFSELLVGIRTELTIEASRVAADTTSSAFSNLQVWVRAYLRGDVNVARAPFFSVLTGVKVA
jgi:HK97 family phage major capsid protein